MNDIRRPSSQNRTAPAGGAQRPSQKKKQRAENDGRPKTIHIRLSIPHLHVPHRARTLWDRYMKLSRRRRGILLVILIVTGIVLSQAITRQTDQATSLPAPTQQNPLDMLEKGTPSYKTLIPAGKSIEDLNGFRRISPKNAAPVYAYADQISNATIRVSQLPLPDNLRSNTDEMIQGIAAEQNATRSILVGSTQVFLGHQSNGYQPVVFVKNDLLVTIRATGVVSDEDWKTYIESLR